MMGVSHDQVTAAKSTGILNAYCEITNLKDGETTSQANLFHKNINSVTMMTSPQSQNSAGEVVPSETHLSGQVQSEPTQTQNVADLKATTFLELP